MGLNIDIINPFNGYLTAAPKIIFTVPGNQRVIIRDITIASEDEDSEREVNVELISYGNRVRLVPEKICPLRTFYLGQTITMVGADHIKAWSDLGNKVSMKISGVREQL